MSSTLLPVSGFVLAGGRSSRMGRDKATLVLGGLTLAEIAVSKLRRFCTEVAISGDRSDLATFARTVPDLHPGCGPIGAVEAGLATCGQPWALFLPVDAPLIPVALLECWVDWTIQRPGIGSYLCSAGRPQPAFCLLRRDLGPKIGQVIERGERRILRVLEDLDAAHGAGSLPACEAESLPWADGRIGVEIERAFLNANTPEEWNSLATIVWDPGL